MHHDDDVRAVLERPSVAGLLVSSVPQVDVVQDRLQAELPSQAHGLVGAGVVHEHNLVDDILIQFSYCPRQRDFSVVGGQHNTDAATINHSASVWNAGGSEPAKGTDRNTVEPIRPVGRRKAGS